MNDRYRLWLRTLILAGTLALVVPLIPPGAGARETDKVLRVAQEIYPAVIDPQKSSYTGELTVLALIYEGLTRLDTNQETVPAAAESWEYNDDATQITFHLRDGLTYSDGTPLTAENFRYAVERTCDPETAGAYQSILFVVAGCAAFAQLGTDEQGNPRDFTDDEYGAARAAVGARALDDLTLQVDLTQPTPYFHTIAYTWVLHPVKREIVAADPEDWWRRPENHIGNGPFRVTGIEENARWTFAANERYWQGRPKLDGIEYVYIPDPEDGMKAYRAGDVDILGIGPTNAPVVADDPELTEQLISVPTATTTTIAFSLTKEPFNDPKVREAFAYAFDRERFCAEVQSGTCVPALTWIPPGTPGYVETDAFAFDPAAARQALAESSYGGAEELPELTLAFYHDVEDKPPVWMEWIAKQYRDMLGVEIVLAPTESETMFALQGGPATFPQMVAFGGWSQDYPDPQNWLSVIWPCDSFDAQVIGYCNEEFDRLVQLGDSTIDPEERLAYYHEAEQLLIADVPVIILSNPIGMYLIKPNVTGITPTASEAVWPGSFSSLMTMDKAA
jgi:oligopeptide transport system substrate-binding protein